MKLYIKVPLVIIILFSFNYESFAQKQNSIGINLNSQIQDGDFLLLPGISLERRFGKRGGFETGLYYVRRRTTGIITMSGPSGSTSSTFSILHRYIAVPLLYKYYSKFLNVSAGPNIEIFAGWKQQKSQGSPEVNYFRPGQDIDLGTLLKVGKTFKLKHFLVEPELRFIMSDSFSDRMLGAGFGLKYRF